MSAASPVAARLLAGGCHCRAVRFTVRVDPESADARVVYCNCSVCTMKGYAHLIVPAGALQLGSGAAALAEYRFGTETARHLFCRHCGIHSFYVPRSHPEGHSVNVHCLDDADRAWAETLPQEGFDGRHWERNIAALRARTRARK